MKLDLLLASIPPNYLNAPSAAPALLKAAAESNGFTCRTLDFSLHIFKKFFHQDYPLYLDWTNVFNDSFNFVNITAEHLDIIDQATDEFINLIDLYQPTFVALSIFSFWQQRFGYFLCKKIKTVRPHIRIILGGMGCSSSPKELISIVHLNYFDFDNNYGMFMQKKLLADHVVINDGEVELVNILKDQDNYVSLSVSNEVPFNYNYYPNFDDYHLDEYFFINGEKELLLRTSKGCVRQCVFCSEHGNYSRFYFKTGKDIANEMIALSQKYQVYKFHLADSLVNGSLKEFKILIKTLSDYNLKNLEKRIKWHGNYICRAKNTMTDNDFATLAASGAHGLTIGAESGSNRVLKEMRKQTAIEDLIYEIDKFHQNGIDCRLMFMVGFYNETWQDFLDTLKLLKSLHKFFYTGTISLIRLGYGLQIPQSSPLWDTLDRENFILDEKNSSNWVYLKNPTLTLKERVRRRIIAQEFCDQMGIPVAFSREDLIVLDGVYNNNLKGLDYNDH
jgi:radical SAM superfamily enzyme YgiQ (UPF0313 family)